MMAEVPQNILIFGATGAIGTYITNAIIDAHTTGDKHFSKIGIFTSPSTVDSKADFIASLKSKGVTVHIGDITNASDIESAYAAGPYDTIVSCIGRAAIASQILLLEIAERTSHVTTFFPSEYGTDIAYGPASKDEPPHQQKLKVRAYVEENVKRLKVTYLVTGPFAEFYLGPGLLDGKWGKAGGFDVKGRRAVLLGSEESNVSLTTMVDVGNLLVAALLHPSPSERVRILIVNSFTATQAEILAEFERQLGGTKFQSSITSLNELRELEQQAYAEAGLGATGVILKRIWTEGGTLYESRDNEKVGYEKAETLEVAVGRAIEAQGGT